MTKVKFLVIGAGPTGIGCALRFLEKDIQDFLLLEKNDYAGGLATTFTDEKGFMWDIGGHVQFSHYKYFDDAMELALGKDGWFHHQRESWVWINDRFVPYPFQNNIHRLDEEIASKCLMDMKNRDTSIDPANFKDWLKKQFGSKLCEIFMYPYNYKVWAFDSSKMSHQWVSERVSPIDVEKIEKNLDEKIDQVSWGPNATFQFPKRGGTGAIWKSLASKIPKDKIRYNSSVMKIDLKQKFVETNGEKIYFEKVLSTMPLDQLCYITNEIPDDLTKMARDFKFSNTHIIGVGVKGKLSDNLKTKCWMYFPEDDCPFYRTTVFSNYSKYNVPSEEYFSLMTETSSSEEKKVNKETLADDVINGLIKTKLISSGDQIESVFSYSTKYGYPTPFLKRDSYLEKLIPYFESKDVFSRGRFGGWKYEVSNQDHTFMQGVEWVDLMIDNKAEETYIL
ncbi:FAD-dependent oxidoreductase [Bacteriovoracaceae bacterium]|nr:FAD-dependent oxidoreductase [Bacteriovoracaceae bacterium]|tara:strand:- start:24806 stop:26155 length:1350 start_codon:yes stop_codon:yes gene_type:complete